MYDELLMDEGVERVVSALCADYPRREGIILRKNAPYNVIMECRFLNYRILDAAMEIAGTRDAISFINDIADGRGYATSDLWALSEKSYKLRKGEVKNNIARRLSLI